MANVEGTLTEISRLFMAISPSQLIVPLPVREMHLVSVGEVGLKIKRLHTLLKNLEKECAELAKQRKDESFEMRAGLGDIVGQILDDEVWRQFPALARGPFMLCSDWTVCREKRDARTRSLAFEYTVIEGKGSPLSIQ